MNKYVTLCWRNYYSITGFRAYSLPQTVDLTQQYSSVIQVDTVVMYLVCEKYEHDDRFRNPRPNMVKGMTVMSVL